MTKMSVYMFTSFFEWTNIGWNRVEFFPRINFKHRISSWTLKHSNLLQKLNRKVSYLISGTGFLPHFKIFTRIFTDLILCDLRNYKLLLGFPSRLLFRRFYSLIRGNCFCCIRSGCSLPMASPFPWSLSPRPPWPSPWVQL